VRGAGFSVTQFLRGTPEIAVEDFLVTFKKFIVTIKLD
jgi:hypothetical protein